jgi:hypothetical protein
VLADHIALVAPGASASDFELVSNHFDGDMRTIGFIQRAGGRRVVGGQVSFRFKNDRLFVIGSEALPNVKVVEPHVRRSAKSIHDTAAASLRRDLVLADAPVTEAGDELVLPLVADDAVLGYRVVRPLTIDGGAAGRYLAYADAASGAVIAVHQQNHFATATLQYHAVARWPGLPRVDRPARRAHVSLDGTAMTTGTDGSLSWTPESVETLQTSVTGDLVNVVNKAAGGASPTAALPLLPGGTTVWNASPTVEDDAEVQVYLNVNLAKEFERTSLDPAMPTLDDQFTANANINDTCNAFYQGAGQNSPQTLNFFHATTKCQNTGLLQDVVFHEFGHAVHANEVIDGVGAIEPGMGEGVADFFAGSMTEDHLIAPGFFYTGEALRDIDPPDTEFKWPDDVGEAHQTGLIFSGVFWDLRSALVTRFGHDEGVKRVLAFYLAAIRRSVDIPSTLIEVLAADDDDGDLSNGTPNECLIRGVYDRHGLRTATGTVTAPAAVAVDTPSVGVVIGIDGLVTRCNTDDIATVSLAWTPGARGAPVAGSTDASPLDAARFYAELPVAPSDDVLYQTVVTFADSTTLKLPANRADQQYQLYQGNTVPLYCTSFDSDPFADGWTTGTADDSPSPWSWAAPNGGATNPHAAFTGTHVLAQNIGGDYPASSYSYVQLPRIDVGQYSDVRLQYRRWLAVEDGNFDQARILANGTQVWTNFNSNMGDGSATQHIDLEWRFHDVPVSGHFLGHQLDLKFDLKSDEGLEFAGWTVDDLCVVANPASICGDGVVSPTEQCDDGAGNGDVADACRTYCRRPVCGDGILDSDEECDAGPGGNPACSPECKTVDLEITGGCCSGSEGGTGAGLLAGLVLGVGLRRRRRPAL